MFLQTVLGSTSIFVRSALGRLQGAYVNAVPILFEDTSRVEETKCVSLDMATPHALYLHVVRSVIALSGYGRTSTISRDSVFVGNS